MIRGFKRVMALSLVFVFLLLFSMVSQTEGSGGDVVEFKGTELQKTGLKKSTFLQSMWMNVKFKKTKSIKLNSIGKQRILENLKNKNASKDTIEKVESISTVPIGQETETTISTSDSSELIVGELPGYVDNSLLPYFPPIRSQGNQGSCASFSSVYYQFTYMNALARNWDVKTSDDSKRFSPKWTYNMVNGGSDWGSYMSDAYNIILKNGAATWSDSPYNEYDYLSWSTNADVWQNALNYRIDSMGTVAGTNTTTGIDNVKQLLTNGYVLEYGTYISSWQYTTIKNDPSNIADNRYVGKQVCSGLNGTIGGHAMVIVGYDDKIWTDLNNNNIIDLGEMGAFRIANSWGTTWQDNGYTWLSYNAVMKGAFFGNEVYWITAKSSYSPKLLAKFTVNTAKRNTIVPYLGYSDLTQNTPLKTLYPAALYYKGGSYSFDGTTTACDGNFVLDYTDLINQYSLSMPTEYRYYLDVNDNMVGNATVLKSFSLINPINGDTVASLNSFPISVDSGLINTVVDYNQNTPLTITSYSPESGTGDALIDSNLVINFDKSVTAVANKSIYIKKSIDDSIFETIPVNDTTQVSISSNVVTINPSINMDYLTEYYVTIDSGAFSCLENNLFAGISDKTDWNFTTIDSNVILVTGITLTQTEASIGTNSSLQLFYTIEPNNATLKTVIWESSNTLVATVSSSGVVTPIAAGTSAITVTTQDGRYTSTCNVTVQSEAVLVTGVTVSPTILNLTERGTTGTLVATISPSNATNKNITWSSSNTLVATVSSSGVVIPITAGTAIITATTEDGRYTSTCNVTVQSATVLVTGVTVSPTTLNLTTGGTTVTLIATISPSNATNKNVIWKTSKASVVKVTGNGLSATLTPGTSRGTATITVTTQDGSFIAVCNVTLSKPSK
ncbi:MAG TPA: hypothetical protein DEP72_07170 [Clostridiales bacterium]|nr:MAG: hypothetical protein A2Y18_08600 [Clostridiales bacterium GWD2_32_19]HCC07915.1 hypothetical protein [Clostridiales bacterium]